MTDTPVAIQAGHYKLFSFSDQLRSLTYDVMSKLPHGYKMLQLATLPLTGNFSPEDETFGK